MAKYTTSVRSICEVNSGLDESKGQANVNDIIANSRDKIFDFPYPIYDEEYRPVLESKILKHYYTREICAETVGRWKLFLDARMNEIMPYYNKLYESELLKFNPLYDVDYTRTSNRVGNQTGAETGTSGNTNVELMTGNISDTGSNTSVLEKTGNVSDTGSNTSVLEKTGNVSDTGSNTSVLEKTGNVSDTGSKSDVFEKTGTVGDSGSNQKVDSMTGTVTDSGLTSYVLEKTGNVKDSSTSNSSDSMTGKVKDDGSDDNTKTTHMTKTNNLDTSTDETTTDIKKNSHWDYYSDTPQGGIRNVPPTSGSNGSTASGEPSIQALTYLTNVRHILDDGTGSQLVIDRDVHDGGTVKDDGTIEDNREMHNTKTYDTVENITSASGNVTTHNTKDETTGTNDNTKIYDTTNSITDTNENTTTYNTKDTNSGVNENTTVYNTKDANSGVNENTTVYNTKDANSGVNENTTVYNTKDANSGLTENTKTYNTKNERVNTGNTSANKTLDTTEAYIERVTGKTNSHSYVKLLQELRDSFLNIDMLIIRDLNDLFFALWE